MLRPHQRELPEDDPSPSLQGTLQDFAAFLLQDILDEMQIVWYFAETLWFLEPKRRCKGQRIWCLVLPVCPTFWDVSIISIQTWSKSTVLVLGFVPKCKLYSHYAGCQGKDQSRWSSQAALLARKLRVGERMDPQNWAEFRPYRL